MFYSHKAGPASPDAAYVHLRPVLQACPHNDRQDLRSGKQESGIRKSARNRRPQDMRGVDRESPASEWAIMDHELRCRRKRAHPAIGWHDRLARLAGRDCTANAVPTIGPAWDGMAKPEQRPASAGLQAAPAARGHQTPGAGIGYPARCLTVGCCRRHGTKEIPSPFGSAEAGNGPPARSPKSSLKSLPRPDAGQRLVGPDRRMAPAWKPCPSFEDAPEQLRLERRAPATTVTSPTPAAA